MNFGENLFFNDINILTIGNLTLIGPNPNPI